MDTKQHIKHRLFSIASLCLLCLFVAAEPIRIANAALTTASSMPCCAGKAAGHCDSGLKAKKVPPPKSEPMCGLHGARIEADGITIVAEPVVESQPSHSHAQTSATGAETSSSNPAVKSATLEKPCRMECGACASVSFRQEKREGIVEATVFHNVSLTTPSNYKTESLRFSSTDISQPINPRGPPARR
jgi:hypothetical protein